MSVYQMGSLRVVGLAKVLSPKTESRRCDLTRFNADGPIPGFHMIVDLTGHLGIHVERLCHHNDNWPDMESLPTTIFMGRVIYVNIEDCEPNHKTTGEGLEKACGDKIKEGDIAIVDFPMKLAPFTPNSSTEEDKRLFICRETAGWFREEEVRCVGLGDGVSIGSNNEDVYVFHDVLIEVNYVFLEILKNLEKLMADTFFMSYPPLPIEGLDSCPVRAYVIEGLTESSR